MQQWWGGFKAGCGGVCRDHNGRRLYGFSKYLGSCNALVAQLWRRLTCMKLALKNGFKKVWFEMDSKVAVEFIKNRVEDSHLIKSVRRWIHKD